MSWSDGWNTVRIYGNCIANKNLAVQYVYAFYYVFSKYTKGLQRMQKKVRIKQKKADILQNLAVADIRLKV